LTFHLFRGIHFIKCDVFIIFITREGKDKISKNPNQDSEEKGDVVDTDVSDILLWALFANRKDLAEICWLRSKDHLCEYQR
jgi:hypothetical protein